jgi:hypothetical protein
VAIESKSGSEAFTRWVDGKCQVAVVDLDDPQWEPLLDRRGPSLLVVGLADDPSEHAASNLVAKPIQARRLMRAIESALDELPEGPESESCPGSSAGVGESGCDPELERPESRQTT